MVRAAVMGGQVLFRAAGERPFVHAREMVVIAVTRPPHRANKRGVRLVFDEECLCDIRKLFHALIRWLSGAPLGSTP